MSTRPVAPEEIPEGWERINVFALRMVVPGGWIYDIAGRGLVLVPEPVTEPEAASQRWHEWEGRSEAARPKHLSLGDKPS
jgi:hypothetical protein